MKKAAGYYQMVPFLFQPPVRQNENKEHTSRSSNMTPGFSFSDDSSDTSSFSSGNTQSPNHIYIHGKLQEF